MNADKDMIFIYTRFVLKNGMVPQMIKKILVASAVALLVAACGMSEQEARNEAGISFTVAKNLSEATVAGRAQLHCNQYGRDAYPAGSEAAKASDQKIINFRCLPPTYPMRNPDGTLTVLFSPMKSDEAAADKKAASICGEEGGATAKRKGAVSTYRGPIKPYISWKEVNYTCTR